jgi:Predicted exporters of the RND superfamily
LKNDLEYKKIRDLRIKLRAKNSREGLTKEEKRRFHEVDRVYRDIHDKINVQRHQEVKQIRSVLKGFRSNATVYLGGVPMITDDMVTFVRNDLIIFGGGVLIFLIIVLFFIFRDLSWMVLPLLSCFYSGSVMIGLLGLIGWNVTVISSNFLALMLIITISMNIHLIVRYRQLVIDYPDKDQMYLVRLTIYKMVKPCFYTALTTIMGFSSLIVSGIKPVIDFGWMMSLGLA